MKSLSQNRFTTGPRKILVPCDFSDCSREALDYAALLAKPFGATLVLLHVIEPVPPGFLMENEISAQSAGSRRDLARQKLAEWAKRAPEGVKSGRPLVKSGKPWQVIVAMAEKSAADLIVMGTHGYTGLKHLMLGSVTERVVRHAPCAVLTVRPRDLAKA